MRSSLRHSDFILTPARGHQGRPTAELVAEKLGVSVHTVKSWLSDNANAEILDEIVPLWPNRPPTYASEHVQEALETLVGIMRSSRSDPMRLQAANTLLALAGAPGPDRRGRQVEQRRQEAARPCCSTCSWEEAKSLSRGRWRGAGDQDREAGKAGRCGHQGPAGTGTEFRLRIARLWAEMRSGLAGAFLFLAQPMSGWPNRPAVSVIAGPVGSQFGRNQ